MGSKSGTLNAKDAWNFLRTPKPQVPWKGWTLDPGQIPRHSYTTRLALLNKLPTFQKFQNRGITQSTTCTLCSRDTEDVDHLFLGVGTPLSSGSLCSLRLGYHGISLSNDRARFGALLRDSHGQFLVGQGSCVPLASINYLELLGVKSGALLCLQLNLGKVQFVTDSTTVTCWLQGRGIVPWTSKQDLIETFDALSHLEDWSISHTFREANAPVDLLAARQSSLGFTIIHTQVIWTELEDSLLQDKQGTIFKRKIADLTEENLH
ncbi:hypothetical protein QJS10_CPB14g01338 [Acorus calamus]|uniref:RNase H type-1 domain-containing protein n=1 Tax=Acorus calamus TaxID=4465 RepID=A0AAV9DCL9_ACOCL|nr:hypothetical protein QJS10_CPB14g01338 [Acorus calamus]